MKLMEQGKALSLMKKYRIKVPQSMVSKSAGSAIKAAARIGFPVVMKILSGDIMHKSDVGGVIVGLNNNEDIEKSYRKLEVIAKKKNAVFGGILLQKIEKGTEVIIGMKRDPQFGPVIMFGLGGVFVEVMEDVAFRVAPVSRKEAGSMIDGIKGYRILKGIRGQKAVNLAALADMISKVSVIAMKEKDIIEMDINPVMANEKEAKAADVRVLR